MMSRRYYCIGPIYKGVRRIHNNIANVQENKYDVKSLCKYLDINESKAQYLCLKHPVIPKLKEERIRSLVDTLSEMGLSSQVLVKEPTLFGTLPITLKCRYKVLKECGVDNITPELLATYLTLIRKQPIGKLKESQLLPTHVNIENRLASYMTQWPTSLTTLIQEDIDKSTLFELRLRIIQRYLELVIDLTNEEFYRGIETYPTIKHRPLEYINETLKILQSQIMIPNRKIKANLYLIHADPDNLKKILYNFRTIGGIDIKEVIRLHPKLATKNYQILLDIRNILEEFGISNEAQRKCFDIYTLSPNTVRERLENAKTTPEFTMFFNHPRFLKMIHYNKTAMKRLRKLYENNKKCLSLNVLSGSSAHFEVFEKAPGDRLGKGKDLLFCISQSLGKKYTTACLRNIIRRHPYWINTPVLQVKFVYEKLSSQFTDEEIYENCPILLYPWNKVKDTLGLLNGRLHELSSVFPDNINDEALSKSQKLSLVLYMLEKNHYFSGNGIWSDDRNNNKKPDSSLKNSEFIQNH